MTLSLAILATQVGDALKQHRWKLATAESCTGGGLSYWITSIQGSSEWFDRGYVTYSNAAKIKMLGVPLQTINMFGAVSEETAKAMASGVLQNSEAQMSIAITGIAGPTGGTELKPVGTVCIAWATPTRLDATHYLFEGDREEIRLQSIRKAMEHLLNIL